MPRISNRMAQRPQIVIESSPVNFDEVSPRERKAVEKIFEEAPEVPDDSDELDPEPII